MWSVREPPLAVQQRLPESVLLFRLTPLSPPPKVLSVELRHRLLEMISLPAAEAGQVVLVRQEQLIMQVMVAPVWSSKFLAQATCLGLAVALVVTTQSISAAWEPVVPVQETVQVH
jgi:hypothetical protein